MKPTYEELERDRDLWKSKADEYLKDYEDEELVSASLRGMVQYYETIISKFVEAEISFQHKAFGSTLIAYGSNRPRKWLKAFEVLQISMEDKYNEANLRRA